MSVMTIAPPPVSPVRPGFRPAATAPLKSDEAKKLRALAGKIDTDHPETVVGGHLRDAARALERGSVKAASRHLAVARHTLTPQQLYRHGVTRGIDHTTARHNAGEVDRRMLALRDIHDMEQDNAAHRQFRAHQQSQAGQERARATAERAADPNRTISTAVMRPGQQGSVLGQSGSRPTSGQEAGSSLSTEMLDLSAQTARLAVTPAPRGRPGGPGLYDVKGMGHTPYLQQIVKALIQKRGMPPGKAYAIARAAIRKWSRGGGHVHPEVQAASGAAESGELARQARARAAHGHANDNDNIRQIWALAWHIADRLDVIELTGTAAGAAKDTHSSATGQFVPAGNQGTKGAKQQPGPSAHQAHVAHMAVLNKVAATGKGTPQQKAQAKAMLKQKIRAAIGQIMTLRKTLAGLLAQQKKLAAGSRRATKAGQTGKTAASTPAKKAQPTTSNNPATAAAAAASTTAVPAKGAASTAAAAATGKASSGASTTRGSKTAAVAAQISGVRKQIGQLNAQIMTWTAQAARL